MYFGGIVLSPVKEVRTSVSGPLIEEGHPTVDAIGACCGGACDCACGGFRSAQEELASLQGLCQPAIKTSHLLQLFEDALPRKKIPTAFLNMIFYAQDLESSLFFSMLPLPRYILFVIQCFAEDVRISCSVTLPAEPFSKKKVFSAPSADRTWTWT